MTRNHPAFQWGLSSIDPKNVRNHGLGLGMKRRIRTLLLPVFLASLLIAGLFVAMWIKDPGVTGSRSVPTAAAE